MSLSIIKSIKLSVLALLLFSIVISPTGSLFIAEVEASDTSITVLMPFEGKWASKKEKVTPPYRDDDNDSHPSLHNPNVADWGTDLYGNNREVKINIDDPKNIYKLRIIQVTNNDCKAGKRVRVGIKNDADKDVGWVQYEHLDTNITVSTSIKNHDVLGKTKNWGYSSCFRVRTNEGVHAHVVMRNMVSNYSCYIDYPYAGIVLTESDALGIIGSVNDGPQQSCAIPPPSNTPIPTKKPTAVNKNINPQNSGSKPNFISGMIKFFQGVFSQGNVIQGDKNAPSKDKVKKKVANTNQTQPSRSTVKDDIEKAKGPIEKNKIAQADVKKYRIKTRDDKVPGAVQIVERDLSNDMHKTHEWSEVQGKKTAELITIIDAKNFSYYVKDSSDNKWWKQVEENKLADAFKDALSKITPSKEKKPIVKTTPQPYEIPAQVSQEKCPNVPSIQCYKLVFGTEGTYTTQYIDTKNYLSRGMTGFFSQYSIDYEYDNISIVTPRETKDIPQGESYLKYWNPALRSAF